MPIRKTPFLACCLILLLAAASIDKARADDSAAPQKVTFPTSTLDIVTQTGTVHFTIEVATTRPEQEYGLMNRKVIPDGTGMIFDFGTPQHVSMWMKDTLVPLDMLYINAQGKIVQITTAAALSTDTVPSGDDTRAVIELAGGAAARHHISTGDKVVYPIFP